MNLNLWGFYVPVPEVHDLYFSIVLHAVTPAEFSGCSCAAGKALRNHVVALLFQTSHYRNIELSSVPTPLPCTSMDSTMAVIKDTGKVGWCMLYKIHNADILYSGLVLLNWVQSPVGVQ